MLHPCALGRCAHGSLSLAALMVAGHVEEAAAATDAAQSSCQTRGNACVVWWERCTVPCCPPAMALLLRMLRCRAMCLHHAARCEAMHGCLCVLWWVVSVCKGRGKGGAWAAPHSASWSPRWRYSEGLAQISHVHVWVAAHRCQRAVHCCACRVPKHPLPAVLCHARLQQAQTPAAMPPVAIRMMHGGQKHAWARPACMQECHGMSMHSSIAAPKACVVVCPSPNYKPVTAPWSESADLLKPMHL